MCNVTNLVTTSTLNAKINEVKNKVPNDCMFLSCHVRVSE